MNLTRWTSRFKFISIYIEENQFMKRLFNIFLLAAILAVSVSTVGVPTSTVYAAGESTQTSPNFLVNTDQDTDDGSCDLLSQGSGNQDCTLREAINAANADND